jgi:glycosyltransferase involved in cell wall biosynthesis
VKIALVAPPLLPVPPIRYGGVERIVGVLADGLYERGHEVTLFAPGDSTFSGRLVATVPEGLWNEGFRADPTEHFRRTAEMVLDRATEFDVIHSHIDGYGFDLAEQSPVPVVSTLHGRTDEDPVAGAIRMHPRVRLIAISDSQRSFAPEGNWIATILHGLDFASSQDFSNRPAGDASHGYLAFVGRLSHDKGIVETVELARLSGRTLRVAAKVLAPNEVDIYRTIIAPAVDEGVVEYMGELGAPDRDRLMGEALATVMLSNWPEPFGLVAIESLALGTPLIAARSGALPEIVVEGVDGFVVDDPVGGAAAVDRIPELDRARIRARTLERFAAARMLDDYERVLTRVTREASSQSAPSTDV